MHETVIVQLCISLLYLKTQARRENSLIISKFDEKSWLKSYLSVVNIKYKYLKSKILHNCSANLFTNHKR
jgi:hypothetical protein